MVSQVPLAENGRCVATGLEHLGDRRLGVVQSVTRPRSQCTMDPDAVGVDPCQQGRA